MLKVGITGGIGSGKSTIAKVFEVFGVPVFNADIEAKKLLNDTRVIQFYFNLLGAEVLVNNELNKKEVAKRLFKDPELVQKANAFIHPLVGELFEQWCLNHKNYPYIIKESALLFETGLYRELDYTILVTAPIEIRIERIRQRDGLTIEEINNRMKNQWPDDMKKSDANYILQNDGRPILKELVSLHNYLLSTAVNK